MICLSPDEIQDHLLFDCPRKLAVWQTLWSIYFPDATCTAYDFHKALDL